MLLSTLVLGLACQAGLADGDDVPTFLDLAPQEALARAADAGLPVVVAWTRDVEEACRDIERTWANPEVRAFLSTETIAIQVDGREQAELARVYKISRYPMTVVMHPDRSVIESFYGHIAPAAFLDSARAALLGALEPATEPKGPASEQPDAWLAYANTRHRAGDHEPATRAYLWCLDRGDDFQPGFRARHLDFLLRRLVGLRMKHGDAILKVVERRDRLEALVLHGEAQPHHALELSRFNFWLRQEARTLEAYERLDREDAGHAALRRVFVAENLKRLVDFRRYDEVLADGGDLPAILRARLERLDLLPRDADDADAAEPSGTGPGPAIDTIERVLVEGGLYYQALLAGARGADGKQIVALLTRAIPEERTYIELMQNAKRLEMVKLVREVAALGIETLPVSARVERVLQRLAPPPPTDEDGE